MYAHSVGRQFDARLRHGVAPLEVAMFLPVLVAFLVVIMYLARIHQAKQHAMLIAECQAAENAILAEATGQLANLPGYVGTDSPDLVQLVRAFQPGLDIKAGGIAGKGESDTGEGVFGDIPPAGTAESRIGFLSQTWESPVLAFPRSASEQPPLTLPRAIRGIAPGMSRLDPFTTLQNFASGASTSSPPSLGTLQNAQQTAVRVAESELARLDRIISELQRRLETLTRSDDPAAVSTVHEVEAAVRQARANRDQIRAALQLANRF